MPDQSVLIVGFGNMTGAMLEGWLAAGMNPSCFTIYGPRPKKHPQSVAFKTKAPESSPDILLLGVKPHMLDEVASQVEHLAGPGTMLVSILAGVELASLARRFPRAGGVVRFMPNLAVAVRKSPNALVAINLDDSQHTAITRLANALGAAEWLPDESQFELVTALAGSGPGFTYRFIAALAEGATSLGLDREQAERLAVQMVEGAGALAAASDASPAELAQRVASPGGMTQKGLDVLDEGRALTRLVEKCLGATRDRGEELAREAREEG